MANTPQPNIDELYARYRTYDLVIDSRRVRSPRGSLFFALPGERTHGVRFIGELLDRGVRHFIVPTDREGDARDALRASNLAKPEVAFTVVADPLMTLQELATYHRRQFTIPVIGITGSNGKTIVKDWLVDLLSARYTVCATPRSYNSQIGVALSVWQLRAEHSIGVFEAGISEAGEMDLLATMICPTVGVFTVLGSAHAAGFAGEAEKLREKCALFRTCEYVVVSHEDRGTQKVLRDMSVQVRAFRVRDGSLEIDGGKPHALSLPALSDIYRQNAHTALATAISLGVDNQHLRTIASGFTVRANRLELREGLHGYAVIDDSYSNDSDALAHAILFSVQHSPTGKITLILGRLQGVRYTQLPADEKRALERLLRALFGQSVAHLITVDIPLEEGFDDTVVHHFTDTESLLRALPNLDLPPYPILVKGGHTQRLRRVADRLSRRRHRTVLRIDLNAIDQNLRFYRSRTAAKIMVMIKAAAYGGGLLPIARTLQENGADYLAVAYPDEGRALRRGGIRLPIMVMNADPAEFADLAEESLEPTLHTLSGVRRAAALGLPCHLEIDTGMARLGFARNEVAALTKEPALARLRIRSVFTHLTASEVNTQDDVTHAQVVHFSEIYERIVRTLSYRPNRHVLNTNGISRFPQYAFEMVRLGIGLYGIGDATNTENLVVAARLTTRIAKIRELPAGTPVGYGGAGVLPRTTRVGTLDIGYADGLPRAAGVGSYAFGPAEMGAPIVGQVCMDMTMVDLTNYPGAQAGDELEVFGPNVPIDQLAKAARTIPYEILTGIGDRVWRVYVRE